MKKQLAAEVETFMENSQYESAANHVATSLQTKLTVVSSRVGSMDWDDKDKNVRRHIFKMKLSSRGKSYTFEFGQSISEGSNVPTMYSVLSCLQKYDVGSFEEFCRAFGYDEDSRRTEKLYKELCKEYKAVSNMFTEEELEVISLIN